MNNNNNEGRGKRRVEILNYSKEMSRIDEVLRAQGTCACSAIQCYNRCAFPIADGAAAAVSVSQSIPDGGH